MNHSPIILLVDDNRGAREKCVKAFHDAGLDAASASSGSEARGLIQAKPFALVLCDVIMPNMSGLELMKEVFAAGDVPRPPAFILMSPESDSAFIVEALAAGARDVLLKPLNLKVLVAKVHRHLLLSDIQN